MRFYILLVLLLGSINCIKFQRCYNTCDLHLEAFHKLYLRNATNITHLKW